MSKKTERKDMTRKPTQARSLVRYENILKTAKELIHEDGCIDLKMSDIAERAEITLGSIYQYFPNKTAIIAALCEQYLAANREAIRTVFIDPPKSLKELSEITTFLLEEFYKMYLEDPVLRDIWAVYSSDKEIQDIEMDDTKHNVETIMEFNSGLFADDKQTEARRALTLILSLGGAAVYNAVAHNKIEGRKIMEEAKVMLNAAWDASITPLEKSN